MRQVVIHERDKTIPLTRTGLGVTCTCLCGRVVPIGSECKGAWRRTPLWSSR